MGTPISEHIKKSPVQQTLKPIREARGLPNAYYTSLEIFHLERDTLMSKNWLCLGFVSDLSQSGYAKPVDFMGLPLLLIRSREDEIRVFHNVCSHRGMKLVQDAGPVKTMLRCPYHSWSYDLKGALKSTPHVGGVNVHKDPAFNCDKHGLREVRSAIWMEMIFVNLSGDAQPFEEYIAPLTERWSPFLGAEGLSLLRAPESGINAGRINIEVNCNWKLAVENYCEAYHLPWVHPSLNSYSRLEDHYNISFGERFAGQGSLAYNLAETAGTTLPQFPDWPKDKLNHAEYISLFPNALLGIQADHVFAMMLEPVSPEKTIEHLRIFYVGDDAVSDEYDASRTAVEESWRVVFSEDIGAVEGMQQGRHSPGFDGGLFTPELDQPTFFFHQWMASHWDREITES